MAKVEEKDKITGKTGGNQGGNNGIQKDKSKAWWVWTAIAIVVFIILLLVFNRRSTVVADDQQPTTIGLLIEKDVMRQIAFI